MSEKLVQMVSPEARRLELIGELHQDKMPGDAEFQKAVSSLEDLLRSTISNLKDPSQMPKESSEALANLRKRFNEIFTAVEATDRGKDMFELAGLLEKVEKAPIGQTEEQWAEAA